MKAFPDLHPDDVKSQIMGVNGEDIVLSPHARQSIPLSIEVKRRKTFTGLYNFMDQAVQDGKHEPVVFLRGDRKDWLVVCNADHYINLLKGLK